MSTLYLVACAKQKQPGTHPAQDLYSSLWFKLARRYVEQEIARAGGEWRILSAKYGLLSPACMTASYEVSLLNMERGPYTEWLFQVQLGLIPWVQYPFSPLRIVFLAGREYRADLQHWLLLRGVTVEVPMQRLGIGKQLAWLKARVG